MTTGYGFYKTICKPDIISSLHGAIIQPCLMYKPLDAIALSNLSVVQLIDSK
jgi:hypothetical protein